MPELHPENLIPASERSLEEVRENGRKGGIISGEVRREKKRMSQMMAELLAEEHDIKIDGELKTLSGEKLLKKVWLRVLAQGGAPAVSLTKVFVEATEGTKQTIKFEDLPSPDEIITAINQKKNNDQN